MFWSLSFKTTASFPNGIDGLKLVSFLVSLCQHSLTVALVRNQHTGYICPQYHVVFDDKFKTVFHTGKSTEELDKICNEFFLESQDCYVEQEYDGDGVLNEVWLLELECQECKVNGD
ncbi:hypothetical protein ACHAW6_012679 [Cyclotella cf. meneghiniana]